VSATRRAQETAAPLAARFGLTAKIYDPRDTPGLVARVAAEPGTVLVVGHSNTVPDIVEQLGGTRPGPLAETDYGDVWRISRADKQTVRMRIGQ
jgi:phosphohistidine phosphatase SixA